MAFPGNRPHRSAAVRFALSTVADAPGWLYSADGVSMPYGLSDLPPMPRLQVLLSCLFAVIISGTAWGDDRPAPRPSDEKVRISLATINDDGVRTHTVQSPFQPGTTTIRVLTPSQVRSLAALYFLPVEPAEQSQYGDPLKEVLRLKLHERLKIVCVVPGFAQMPWYADHPTDPQIRQESYFLRVVVPFIEKEYPVDKSRSGRWLIGFSKGGYGAVSLLLRHPELFDRAAAWDAPFMLEHPNRYQMADIFDNQQNFDRYRIPQLVTSQVEKLQQEPRLILTGYNLFRDHHTKLHRQLTSQKIPHIYRDGPQREHRWNSGWLEEAVSQLATLPRAPSKTGGKHLQTPLKSM